MAKRAKMNTDYTNLVQLVKDSELQAELGEAFSAILISPAVSWAKFVLTDDQVNANGQRIPESEFRNLITSGIYMPIKMAMGAIKDNHDDAEPLGVIAHLKQEENKIMALAALWNRERPADVQYIKELVSSGQPVNISWEILFGDYNMDENGTVDLLDTTLRAATIVGDPAYQGRTRLVAVAARKWSPAFISELEDECFLYVDGETRLFPYMDENGKVDPTRFKVIKDDLAQASLSKEVKKNVMEKLNDIEESFKSAVADANNDNEDSEESILDELKDLKDKNELLEEKVGSLESQLNEYNEKLTAKDAEFEAVSTELNELREFKQAVEAEAEKAEKLANIKTKFNEAGIEKDDDYFASNEELLLSLDEAALEFMIQELVSFASALGSGDNTDESGASIKVPNLSNPPEIKDAKELAKALRARKAK